jgi:hypothetical protein
MNKQYLVTLFLAIFCITAKAQDGNKKIKEVVVSERVQPQNKKSQYSVNSIEKGKEVKELEKVVAKEEKSIGQMQAMFEKSEAKYKY